jgi:hypothetical protein
MGNSIEDTSKSTAEEIKKNDKEVHCQTFSILDCFDTVVVIISNSNKKNRVKSSKVVWFHADKTNQFTHYF